MPHSSFSSEQIVGWRVRAMLHFGSRALDEIPKGSEGMLTGPIEIFAKNDAEMQAYEDLARDVDRLRNVLEHPDTIATAISELEESLAQIGRGQEPSGPVTYEEAIASLTGDAALAAHIALHVLWENIPNREKIAEHSAAYVPWLKLI